MKGEQLFIYNAWADSKFPFPTLPTINIDQWFLQETYRKPPNIARPDLYPYTGVEAVIYDILTPFKSLTLKLDEDIGTTLGLHGKSIPLTTIKNAPMGPPPGGHGVVIQRFDSNIRIFVWDNDKGVWIGLQIPDIGVVTKVTTTGIDGQVLVRDSLSSFGVKWADTGNFIHHTEVNFGTLGARSKTFTIVDSDAVVGQHHIMAFQSANAATGRSQDENEMDTIIYRAVPGPVDGQITVYADSLFGPVAGLYVLHYIVTPMHIM